MRSSLWPCTAKLLPDSVLDVVAAGAVEADREGRLSAASLEALRSSGYLGAPVPTTYEGGGASLEECCALQRRLGGADPALAIALNMHLFSVGVLVEHWRRHGDTSWMLLEAIAGQQRIVASGFAEPGLGGSLLRSGCTAVRTDGGWLLNGVKSPCSLAASADLICMQVQALDDDPESLLVVLLPREVDGLSVKRTWDTVGMRASESDTVVLEKCFVPDDLVFHRCTPGFDLDEVFTAGLAWFCLTATATYLGLLEAALDEAGRILARSKLQPGGHLRRDLPTFQAVFGDGVATLLTVDAACSGLARQLDSGADPRQLIEACLALKYRAAGLVLSAVDVGAEAAGVQTYGRTGTYARLWRDAQAVRHHPPTAAASRQILGRWGLGLPYSYELLDTPSPAAVGEPVAP